MAKAMTTLIALGSRQTYATASQAKSDYITWSTRPSWFFSHTLKSMGRPGYEACVCVWVQCLHIEFSNKGVFLSVRYNMCDWGLIVWQSLKKILLRPCWAPVLWCALLWMLVRYMCLWAWPCGWGDLLSSLVPGVWCMWFGVLNFSGVEVPCVNLQVVWK